MLWCPAADPLSFEGNYTAREMGAYRVAVVRDRTFPAHYRDGGHAISV